MAKEIPRINIIAEDLEVNEFEEKFDSTGMFHWVPEQDIEANTIQPNQKNTFKNHVIVCIFADSKSPVLGLRSFVLPLRASNYHYKELKPIVFIGDATFLAAEWKSICNFPKLFILPGSPNDRSNLRAVTIQYCSMCVIISSTQRDTTDTYLVDKSSILCSLNIRAMEFEDDTELFEEGLNESKQCISSIAFSSNSSVKFFKNIHVPVLTELSKSILFNSTF